MRPSLILASSSTSRATLLRNAGVAFEAYPPRLDEHMIKESMISENLSCRDMADHLAELKASKVASKFPNSFIIGSDQILEFQGQVISKPHSKAELFAQLQAFQNKTHKLFTAAVICHETRPIWRHISKVDVTFRPLSRSETVVAEVETAVAEPRHSSVEMAPCTNGHVKGHG